MNVDQVIEAYIKLRDHTDQMKKKHKEELQPYTERMEKIEAWLQKTLTEMGLENFKGRSGTAYLKQVSSATVEDREAFLQFVRESGLWELLESRCSKSVVDDYIEAKGEIPPGVKYQRTIVTQVRRGA